MKSMDPMEKDLQKARTNLKKEKTKLTGYQKKVKESKGFIAFLKETIAKILSAQKKGKNQY